MACFIQLIVIVLIIVNYSLFVKLNLVMVCFVVYRTVKLHFQITRAAKNPEFKCPVKCFRVNLSTPQTRSYVTNFFPFEAVNNITTCQSYLYLYNIYSVLWLRKKKQEGYIVTRVRVPWQSILVTYVVSALTGFGGRLQLLLKLLWKTKAKHNVLRVYQSILEETVRGKKIVVIWDLVILD